MSEYGGQCGSKYRIVKKTLANGTFKYSIEKQSVHDLNRWNHITDRNHIADTRHAVALLRGEEVVASEVVE